MDPPHMDELKLDDQLEHTYSSYVRIRDVAQKTCQRRWTIGKSGKRGLSVLAVWHDDDDDSFIYQITQSEAIHNVSVYQQLWYYKPQRVPFYSLNCFSYMIYLPQNSTYQNIAGLLTHPSIVSKLFHLIFSTSFI